MPLAARDPVVPAPSRIERRACGGDDVGMEAQAEVVVRPAHQRAASRDDDFGRAEHFVDDGVERHRAVAERGDPLGDRLKLVEEVHQLTLSAAGQEGAGLEAGARLRAPHLAARGTRNRAGRRDDHAIELEPGGLANAAAHVIDDVLGRQAGARFEDRDHLVGFVRPG